MSAYAQRTLICASSTPAERPPSSTGRGGQPTADSAPAAAERAVFQASVSLARALRGAGIQAGVDRQLVFCRTLCHLDLARRSDVYWAARATYVHDPLERVRFIRDEIRRRVEGLLRDLGIAPARR